MRIYLDVSCLNRPFDDQTQLRIRLEAEVMLLVLERLDTGEWEQVSSEAAIIEINANPDAERRSRLGLLLPDAKRIIKLTTASWDRASKLAELGFRPGDAAHLAAAEQGAADVLLSCDDRLCRLAKRSKDSLRVAVRNPVDWLKEVEHDADAG